MRSPSAKPIHELLRGVDSGGLAWRSSGSAAVTPPIARSREVRAREAASLRSRELSTRALNVLIAFFLILFSLPFMALIAAAVRLTSRGPVIYAQDRVGLDTRARRRRRRGPARPGIDRRRRDLGGRIFKIYKFRTMYMAGGSSHTPQVWARRQDPRVTPVGRFLRAHRLDELPQLFNVLKGDMNLVGPRPEQPEIFQQLKKTIPVYPERQRVRPGITGWAQIHHCYDASLDDVRRKLHYDLDYVKRRSVAKDVLIMAKTPAVMLFKQGSH